MKVHIIERRYRSINRLLQDLFKEEVREEEELPVILYDGPYVLQNYQWPTELIESTTEEQKK